MFTLQQAETTTIPQLPQSTKPEMMIAPVMPEDVPLQCRYDPAVAAWRCSYASWFRQPATYTVILVGVLGFGLGFLIAAFPPVRKAVETARAVSPI